MNTERGGGRRVPEDLRATRRFTELFQRYVEALQERGFVDPDEILAAHPEFGPALLEDLETYIQLRPFEAEEPGPEPLGNLGDYTLRQRIGRGGMGVVYEAWQNTLERRVALKVLPPGIAADTQAFTRFMREARTAAQLNHPSVVRVHSVGLEEDTPYYAMEYVEGETLAEVLRKFTPADADTETPFGPKNQGDYFVRLARAFAGVADGLQHAHSKRVIHRDIKPSNLILDAEGDREGSSKPERDGGQSPRLRILDFGLAHLEGQESLTNSGDVVGTPLYMSPEQARRKKIPIDHRSDIYSLGAAMYEALTGRPPFRGRDHADTLTQIIQRDPTPPRQLNPRLPSDLETIVLKCLRKDPEDRFGTAEALAQDLRRYARCDPIEARPQALWECLKVRLKRQRTVIAVLSIITLLLLLVSWQTYRSERAEIEREAAIEEARQAEHEAQRARYEVAVFGVLKKISALQFSFKVVSGNTPEALQFTNRARELPPLTWKDFRPLRDESDYAPIDEALAELKAVAEALPDERDAHYHLARAYFILERPESAREALEQALRCDPTFVPARILRGDAFEGVWGEYQGSNGWERAWLLAHLSVRNKKWRKAVRAYGRLIALGRETEPYIGALVEAHLNCGVARLEMRDAVGAQRDLTIAHYLAPGFESTLLLGKAHYLAGQTERAEEIFQALYEDARTEQREEAGLWIVGVYNSLLADQEAREWTERLGDDVAVKERLRGYFLYRRGEWREAEVAARRAIERDPDDFVAHLVLGRTCLVDFWDGPRRERARKVEELLRVSRAAVDLDPDSALARRLFARAEGVRGHEFRRLIRSGTMKQEMARSRWSWLTALTLGAGGITTSVEADCDLDKIHQFVPIFRSTSVSADGDYAAVGVPWLLAKQGAVFVLRRDGESWVKEDELRRPGNFGWSVSLSGDRLAVTSAGPPQSAPVYIFRRKGTEWVEEDEIQGGRLVALHRDRLLTGSGPVSVFRREGTSWTLEQELLSLGGDPALDDNVVVSGDPARGRVNVFRRISDEIGSRWYPEGPLSAGDSCPDFGSVVSVSGDVLVVGGAPNYNGTNCGRAYVFRYDGEEWLEEQQLVGVDVETSDQFGASVAVRGDLALVGAHAEPCCDYRGDGFGYVSVFRYDGAEWREESTLAPPDATTDDKFGWKVALSGGTAYLPAATEVYACDVAASEPVGPTFLRGDCDADGSVNITDGVVLLGSLFLGEGAPSCLSACDFNRSGSLDITTSVYLFQHLFVGGPALPAPSAECGPISELDGVLGCEASQTSCR